MSTIFRRGYYFLLSIVTIINLCLPASVFATSLITGSSTIAPNIPLIVTAYRARLATATSDSKTGKVLTQYLGDITLLELYNLGDIPLSLSTLHIFDAADTHRELVFNRDRLGYVLPHEHVSIAAATELTGTTYISSGWSAPATKDAAVPGIKLIMDGYRSGQVDIKTTASGTVEKRAYGVSSYLSTFNDAATVGTSNVDTYLTDAIFDDGLYNAPDEPHGLEVSEIYAYSSECTPFDASVLCSDFIELHNGGNTSLDLDGLVLRTDSNSSSRTSSNTFTLSGVLAPDGYFLVNQTDEGGHISLTNSGGYIWLEDAYEMAAPYSTIVISWPSVSSNEQGYGYMRAADGAWQWTASPTPGTANVYTEPIATLEVCPEGKYRSPETGRCRAIEEVVSELATCEEGYERNPTTNRCRKITTATSTLTPCGDGQERNPATNRCRSIASAVAELLPCDEGYERNPATNRCRKVQSTSIPSAPFAPAAVATELPTWQWWMGGAVGVAVAGYAIWEWRHELAGLWHRLVKR